MTGRELIIYILTNHLEDEPVFKDGQFVGFLSTIEAAEKMDVGVATTLALISQGKIEAVQVTGGLYIPANFKAKGVINNG